MTRLGRAAKASSFGWAMLLLMGFSLAALASDLDDVRMLFLKGDYAECVRQADKALPERDSDEDWRLLQVEALMAQGRYSNALAAVEQGLLRTYGSIRLRLLAYDVCRQNGDPERARRLIDEINTLAAARARWAYQDAPNLVALGRAALVLGAEPRRVLELYFDKAKRADPNSREVYLASGQLALDKDDSALAAKTFSDGVKNFPADPDLQFGLAQAYQSSDRRQMLASLNRVLDQNPNHVPSLLLLADHAIDAEEYGAAEKTLARALKVNPWRPEAWAYRAVMAHLRNDTNAEAQARGTALKFWNANPLVDHLIGRKLSQKYRFAEGAARQRQALAFDRDYLPARMQLAQDLLRLGDETEGWRLAQAVHEADGYNVEAYNLATLHDTLEKFRTLTNQHFILRMGAREADIYGPRALGLLERARTALSRKYGIEFTRPVVVEIFPDQKDFGVRTFGIPDNPGYAGVCFGYVITANSPGSQTAQPVNWEAVLWHEFAHVVTLNLTRNKMPRWLSEGISVFEERQANPTWGQAMNARYREMVLGDDLKKVSELSAAFLTPKSEEYLQFAYFQAGLVVEYLVERFGLDALKAILRDLGTGMEVNAAIASNTAAMDEVERQFAAFARQRAETLAPGLDWKKPEADELAHADDAWFAKHPTNFYALNQQARNHLRTKKWREARAPLEQLLKEYPGYTDAYPLLAQAYRGLGETNLENSVLATQAAIDADAIEAYLRLMELASAATNWRTVIENAERYLAVNPLLPRPYRFLARASEETGQLDSAVRAYRILLELDPPDPAEAHYRLARLLHQSGDPGAKRQLLQSLEEAPRFREALRLLLQMNREEAVPKAAAAAASPAGVLPEEPAVRP
jgi:tetratricopeptide (TPR) repeat protein